MAKVNPKEKELMEAAKMHKEKNEMVSEIIDGKKLNVTQAGQTTFATEVPPTRPDRVPKDYPMAYRAVHSPASQKLYTMTYRERNIVDKDILLTGLSLSEVIELAKAVASFEGTIMARIEEEEKPEVPMYAQPATEKAS